MQINVTYDSSVANAPAGFQDCVAAACAFFDSTFTAPVTINIHIGYGEVDGTPMKSNALGESESNYAFVTYGQLRTALIEQGARGASTLPVNQPAGYLDVSTAEAKALGVMAAANTTIDGWVGISSAYTFTSDPNNRAVFGAYDLVGVLEHEISEVMGRTSSLDAFNSYSPLDLFRYDAPGILQGGHGDPSYFSVDGGQTSLADFNNDVTGSSKSDLGDWAASAGLDAFRANNSGEGNENLVTPTDVTVMQAIGWTTTSAGAAPSGTIAWSNATSDYAGLPGGHFSIALPFTSSSARLFLANDGGSVDMSYNSPSGTGFDTLTNVEFLQFSDKTIFVETADNAAVARLYQAALGRAPDLPGLSGWENVYTQVSAAAKAQGTFVSLAETPVAGLSSIAAGFTNSTEFQQKYGTLSDTAFVTQLYQNVLGRAPDQAGLDGWLNAMHQGDANGQIYTREMVIVGFAESPENIAKTADWLFSV
ncbi:MAG TPA: NF038122 family metalloprotease [Methylovirgula sp.]|nr:NF038122 family metalloprotease [Methylovirgula sp.]